MRAVSSAEVGLFVDHVWANSSQPYRSKAAVAHRALEEMVEVCLAAGVSPGGIYTAVTDSLANQALKQSKKDGRTVYPSQLSAEVDIKELREEIADVRLVLLDLQYLVDNAASKDQDNVEREKWESFKQKTFAVSDSGCLYAIKPHVVYAS